MASDSQPSFRASLKTKFREVIKPNMTSSIREQFNSADTYKNFTNMVKDLPGVGTIINKTKGIIPGVFSSSDNKTFAKGFYDSVFSAETENDIYFKVATMCLWIIAILCIIPTIITICTPVKKYGIKACGTKMIFLHILICELFYLIYILLSMINVAQNFQLINLFCNFANYGMYVTIPVMHCALFLLSMERLSTRLNSTISWTGIFKKTYLIQIILIFTWIILIALMTTIILLKDQIISYGPDLIKDHAPPIVDDVLGRIVSSSYRCSIDGRLSSVFKVLFVILFLILIALIIKSIAISVFYNFFTPDCCKIKKLIKKHDDHNTTLLFAIFLLLNICLSYPFYFISITNTVRQFVTREDTYTTSLKVCFLLRICSIIFQCLTFYTCENNSWTLLSRLLYHGTCKKIPVLNQNDILTEIKSTTGNSRSSGTSDHRIGAHISRSKSDSDDSPTGDESEGDDDVFEEVIKVEPLHSKKPVTKLDRCDSDDEMELIEKIKASTRKADTHENSNEKKARPLIKKPTTEHTTADALTQKSSRSKPTSKPNINHNKTKRNSISSSSSESDDSNVSKDSDDEIKPVKIIPKAKPTTHSSVNEQKHSIKTLPSKYQARKHLQSSSSTNSDSKKEKKPPVKLSKNLKDHSRKRRKDRASNLLDQSDEV
ncbi:unnamed protein product [Rotaria magnacalcarata]|uniref:Uncharacterized protein n=1 Tax=Rotaria magnacalcarata TaxID=392030 RepID=A0A819E9L9_9BILA|nr:unnamed protein product [Rotaria magnacalcarata]CAF3846934.1 unnamed protein product [Rotaria magnacalcarata]